jgi:hypothetical protein
MRPAEIVHHAAVLDEAGEVVTPYDETVRPAETEAEFLARMVADHVPSGARHVVVDAAALPDGVPLERWGVDWATGAITVLPPPPPSAADVRAEFTRRMTAALQDKRPSILSYGLKLNGRVSAGIAAGKAISDVLTADQLADVALMYDIDDWESAMVDKREALIAALAGRSGAGADAGPPVDAAALAADAAWPPQPAGLTDAWLAGF